MPEENQTDIETTDSDESKGSDEQKETKSFSSDEVKKIISQRDEKNKQISALQKQLDEISKQKKEADDNKLKEQGKTQELLDSKIKELEDKNLQLQALEKIKQEKEEQEEIFRKELLTGLTKDQRDFLKDKSIPEIKKGRELFGVKSSVDVDSGRSINGTVEVKFKNDKDQIEAEIMGLSAEKYYQLKKNNETREKEREEKFNKLNKGIKL